MSNRTAPTSAENTRSGGVDGQADSEPTTGRTRPKWRIKKLGSMWGTRDPNRDHSSGNIWRIEPTWPDALTSVLAQIAHRRDLDIDAIQNPEVPC